MIKKLITKIKNFIIKFFKPILQKLNILPSDEDNNAIIESLEGVGIKLYDDKVKTESTVYNPIVYGNNNGNHNLRYIYRFLINSIGTVLDIKDLNHKIDTLYDIIGGNLFGHGFNYEIKSIEIDRDWILESYVQDSYKILDRCLEMQENVNTSNTMSAYHKHGMLNLIVAISNRLNLSLTMLHKAVYTFLDPLTKEVVSKFKSSDHIIEFVNLYTDKANSNYLSLKQTLLKILKRSKYSFGIGSSRIYIPGDPNSQHGYKIAINKKGIIDNKTELTMWSELSKTSLAGSFVPITKMSNGENDMIVLCKKASDVGKVSRDTAYKLIKSLKLLRSKESSPTINKANFESDIFLKHELNIRTIDGIYNKGNVGTISGDPVIIDYANTLHF